MLAALDPVCEKNQDLWSKISLKNLKLQKCPGGWNRPPETKESASHHVFSWNKWSGSAPWRKPPRIFDSTEAVCEAHHEILWFFEILKNHDFEVGKIIENTLNDHLKSYSLIPGWFRFETIVFFNFSWNPEISEIHLCARQTLNRMTSGLACDMVWNLN